MPTFFATVVNPTTAMLTPIGRWPTETTPRGFAIDPRGRFLLVVGLDSNSLSTYAIDQVSGVLTLRSQQVVGKMPNWVEIVDFP